MENLKFAFRAVINCMSRERCTVKEIDDRLCAIYEDCMLSYGTMTGWFNEFQCRCHSLKDDPRSAVSDVCYCHCGKLTMDGRKITEL